MVYHILLRCCSSDDTSLNRILRSEELFESIELLSSDLLYQMDSGHCYVLVTDPLYSEILQVKLFTEIERSSYFVIQVRFSEDLMSPRNATVAALREAHRSGCGCYLIYLANGIQMIRFLRFVDRTRVINAEAKLIILHDYRLFGPQMHYIWKRFVNVIFVRQYEHSFHGNRSSTNGTAFELTTVPYPLPINEVFVTRRLNFWRNGRYQHGKKLNLDKTGDLEGKRPTILNWKRNEWRFP